MTELELIAQKTSRVRGRLDRIRSGTAGGRERFADDVGRVEQVAFNVFLAMQESADMASHIVTEDGWGAPASLAETFALLASHGLLTTATAEAMKRGTRLRNLIAHAYGDLDPDKLFMAATAGVDQIERFLGEVAGWVERGPRGPA
jgi:uncharacterized protein YutE (UPF0331/DUF86 family)